MKPERFNNYNKYIKERFKERVYKITIDAGFTCPNRDGKVSVGGCTYCSNRSFNPNQIFVKKTISEQVYAGREALKRRYGVKKFMAYFQAYTNTYEKPEFLLEKYNQALVDDSIVGIAIGTRPDCLDEDILDVLSEISKKVYLSLEIGVQSSNNDTLKRINRGHDWETFVDALKRSKKRGFEVCTHVILGLPGESRKDMVQTAKDISAVGVDGVKIHPLYVCKNTTLEKQFYSNEIKVMEMDEYVDLVCDFLTFLSPDVLIHRLTSQSQSDTLIAPDWINSKMQVLNKIRKRMEDLDYWQGKAL